MGDWLHSVVLWAVHASGVTTVSSDALAQATVGLLGTIIQAATGVLLAAVAGGIAWFVVTRRQMRLAQEMRRIERLRILHELDESFQAIVVQRSVVLNRSVYADLTPDTDGLFVFETILTRRFTWVTEVLPETRDAPNPHAWVGGARAVRFLGNGSTVQTMPLHQVIYWFRRVARARTDGIVHDADVYMMWRQILPFATDGRFSFMARYFGVTGDLSLARGTSLSADVEGIADLTACIVRYCLDHNVIEPLDYLGCTLGDDDTPRYGRLDPWMYRLLFGQDSPYALSGTSLFNGAKLRFWPSA